MRVRRKTSCGAGARAGLAVIVTILGFGPPETAQAVTLAELDPGAELRVREVAIEGNESYWSRTLSGKIATAERPWWAPWRAHPELDPFTLEDDLERLRRFYESEGYWHVNVSHDLRIEARFVDVVIRIEEGARVETGAVRAGITDEPAGGEPLPEEISLQPGEPFTEAAYQRAEADLRRFYLERSYAQVEVERSAEVDLDRDLADASFLVTLGPRSVFGTTRIEGTRDVAPGLVEREIDWVEGESFGFEAIERTRNRLLALELFRSVRIGWEARAAEPSVVDVTVEVEEQPPRRVRIGVGYGTLDEFRTRFEWSHFNWLGDGRRLTAGLTLSTITREIASKLVQPHFGTRRTSGVLELRSGQDDEDTYALLGTHFLPRLEHAFGDTLSASLGWRLTWAKVSEVDAATAEAIGGLRREGFISGPTLTLAHDTTESLLDPKRGHVIALRAFQGESVWGSEYRYYKAAVEVKQYVEVLDDTVLAGRVMVGIGDTLGDPEDFPIFDRYFAGGQRSVRGYGRRRLGPLSVTDRPLGGLSLFEGAIELRRAVRGPLGAVAFFDFGQVSLDAYDVPVGDLDYAAGPGLSVATPVGPLALFVGFPFDPPAGDPGWTLHFSIGAFF